MEPRAGGWLSRTANLVHNGPSGRAENVAEPSAEMPTDLACSLTELRWLSNSSTKCSDVRHARA